MLLHIVFLNLNSQLINIAGSLKDSRLCMRYAIISGIQQTKYYFYSYFEQSSSSFLFSSRNAGETSIAHCLSLDSQKRKRTMHKGLWAWYCSVSCGLLSVPTPSPPRHFPVTSPQIVSDTTNPHCSKISTWLPAPPDPSWGFTSMNGMTSIPKLI